MSYLFQITEKVVFPNAETLRIFPFNQIWERDTSKEKHTALKELTYIEFMTSQLKSNPYREYPENKKHEVICLEVMRDESYQPDLLVRQGMDKIYTFQTEGSENYTYYMAAKRVAGKMKDFFNTVNINERNEKTGNPIWKPRDITAALNDTEKTLANLNALKKKVEEELYEETKMRSDKQISPFADPSSLNQM